MIHASWLMGKAVSPDYEGPPVGRSSTQWMQIRRLIPGLFPDYAPRQSSKFKEAGPLADTRYGECSIIVRRWPLPHE